MSFAPGPKDAQISISVFGGLATQPSPINLPEGLSPDNQEVCFFPGGVSSRPGFQRVFTGSLGAVNLRYGKTYISPSGAVLNLYLDSSGKFWYEDVLSTPGVLAQLVDFGAGLYAKSVTAFGREYIALSDGLHGADVPLQFDGTNLDRITQDGPGAPPAVASVALPAVTMVADASTAVVLDLNEADPAGLLPDGSFSRINFWTPDDISTLAAGKRVTVAGYTGSSAAMNGTWTVLEIWPANGHPFGSLVILQANLPAGTVYSTAAGATATVGAGGTTMTRANHVVTVRTVKPHSLRKGFQVQISGVPASEVGGTGDETTGNGSGVTTTRPTVLLNGWAANAHVGDYEHGVDQGHYFGLDAGATGAYTDAAKAVDADVNTYAKVELASTHAYAGCVWSFAAFTIPGQLYLKILSEVPTLLIPTLRSAGIWYSLDAGATWHQVYNEATRAKAWDMIPLPVGQDISKVQVMAFTDSHDDQEHRVYDIRIEGGSSSGSQGGTSEPEVLGSGTCDVTPGDSTSTVTATAVDSGAQPLPIIHHGAFPLGSSDITLDALDTVVQVGWSVDITGFRIGDGQAFGFPATVSGIDNSGATTVLTVSATMLYSAMGPVQVAIHRPQEAFWTAWNPSDTTITVDGTEYPVVSFDSATQCTINGVVGPLADVAYSVSSATGATSGPAGGGTTIPGESSTGLSITIDNESAPGIATVHTPKPHGLSPGCFVSISEVEGVDAGGGIEDAVRSGGIVTIKTLGAHGLTPGAIATIAGTSSDAINTTAPVVNVPDPQHFTVIEPGASSDIASLGAGGSVTLNWPLLNTGAPTYFEVLSCPTPNSFTIGLNYSNGVWITGRVKYAWEGTFFLSDVPDGYTIQYEQYGPDATTDAVGIVTPHGQLAPGPHQCQLHFLTRQGYLTKGSPTVKFMAAGGQYVSVTNIAKGPANVVARVLSFTGSSGAYFYYIPTAAQVNGQIVSTATQIDDNTSTEALLDFSDLTLYAATGVSIPGSNVAAQMILDGALGFGFYGSRLLVWGMRNRVQSFLNMGFEGGALPDTPTQPAGWTISGAVGALDSGHIVGQSYAFSGAGNISQPAYRDAYGAPILQPNTKYRFRCWSSGLATITVTLEGTSFVSTATIASTAAAGWHEVAFSLKTPVTVPADLVLKVSVNAAVTIDELSVIYDDQPYLDKLIYASYVDNPEAFDGVAGKVGSKEDSHKVMDAADIRQTGYFLTQEPGGRLHQFFDNGVTEPAGWSVNQVAANCGLLSAFGLTKSQDDSSSSGGEEWFAWASLAGARIFSGSEPHLISEEIQPDWDRINRAAHKTVWAFNDPASRTLYFGLPLDDATAPSRIYPLNYRGLDSAEMIAQANPILPGFAGRNGTLDRARKWTRWMRACNGGGLMIRGRNRLCPVFLCGPNYGQAYVLNSCYYTDDDYGSLAPYYVSFFAPTPDLETALGLGTDRKTLVYVSSACEGTGYVTITALVNALDNPWPLTVKRRLKQNPKFDLEWSGANATGQRIAVKLAWSLT